MQMKKNMNAKCYIFLEGRVNVSAVQDQRGGGQRWSKVVKVVKGGQRWSKYPSKTFKHGIKSSNHGD